MDFVKPGSDSRHAVVEVGHGPMRPQLGRFVWLSVFGGTCVLAGAAYAITGQGLPCPFLLATGWLCPFCGSSRMGVALLRGDLAAAWGWNPFVLVLGAWLAAVWLWTAVQLIRPRSVRWPGARGVVEGVPPVFVVLVITGLGLAYMVLRNIL